MNTCQNCHGAHPIQRCPAIRELLRIDALACDECEHVLPVTSFTFQRTIDLCICDTCYHDIMETAPIRCDECDDVIDHAGTCPACREVDPYGISLELRASVKATALAIDPTLGW